MSEYQHIPPQTAHTQELPGSQASPQRTSSAFGTVLLYTRYSGCDYMMIWMDDFLVVIIK